MTTQIIFKLDVGLKDRAMKKAKKEGVPLAAILKLAMKAYVDGQLDVGIISTPAFNASSAQEITHALSEIKTRKNLSRGFKNAHEATAYLKKA